MENLYKFENDKLYLKCIDGSLHPAFIRYKTFLGKPIEEFGEYEDGYMVKEIDTSFKDIIEKKLKECIRYKIHNTTFINIKYLVNYAGIKSIYKGGFGYVYKNLKNNIKEVLGLDLNGKSNRYDITIHTEIDLISNKVKFNYKTPDNLYIEKYNGLEYDIEEELLNALLDNINHIYIPFTYTMLRNSYKDIKFKDIKFNNEIYPNIANYKIERR